MLLNLGILLKIHMQLNTMLHGPLTYDLIVKVHQKSIAMEWLLIATIKKLKSHKLDNNNFWKVKIRDNPTLIAVNFHTWFPNFIKKLLNSRNRQFNFILHWETMGKIIISKTKLNSQQYRSKKNIKRPNYLKRYENKLLNLGTYEKNKKHWKRWFIDCWGWETELSSIQLKNSKDKKLCSS